MILEILVSSMLAVIFGALLLLAFAPFILSGKLSREEEHRAELREADERAQMLGEELKKYTAEAKGDCKACMVRRGIVSSERELEIEVGR